MTTVSNSWKHYNPDNFRVASTRRQNYTSAPISSTPVSSTSAAQITSNVSLQHLCADVKAILQSVEASLEEQKKISKDLNDLGTTVNILEGVLCGNVGGKKRGGNMGLDTVQSEGGVVRRLATMDGAINDLLARVSRLDTASLCCDANTTARRPSPPLQKEYLDTSTGTDEPLTPAAPPSCRLKFPPWFPPVQHSPKTLTPASWNTNRNNPYRAPAFARPQGYIHSVRRDSSLSGSTESRASPEFTMSPGVFNHASSPAIAAPTTFYTRAPINVPDLSSPFQTPSSETSTEESFSRTNNSNSRSWSAPQPRRDGPDQNMSTTSLRAFPSSLLNPIPPSSTNPTHKPAPTSLLSAFRSLDSRSNLAPSHSLTLPPTSSTSGSSNSNASSLASRIVPIALTPPSPSSAHTAYMHLASPPPTPTSTLAQAHATASCHILPQVYQDIGGDVDCEGSCADCEMRHYEHYGRRSQGTDFQEQSAGEDTRDQSTIVGSSRMCLNTSSGEIGTPSPSVSGASAPEAQPKVPRVPLPMFETQNQSTIADPSRLCFDTSSGELDYQSPSLGANADTSHLDKQPEGPGVEKEVPVSAFEVQDQNTIVDSQHMRLDRPRGELDHPSRSFEVNAEASPHMHGAQLEGPGIEPEAPLPVSEPRHEYSGGEPKSTQSTPRARPRSFLSQVIDLDALQRLIQGHELPLWHGFGAARTHEDGEPRGSGHLWTDDYGDVNGEFGGPSLEESLRLGRTPDAGGSGELGLDSLNEPGYDDSRECEREQGLHIEHECGGLDGTLEESFKSAEERPDVSLTLNDTPKPLTADTRDACPREYHPEKTADSEDSAQPKPVLSELRQPTPSDLACLNADYLNQYEDIRVEDSREETPADSLLREEEAVAAALTAPSPSAESESPPLSSSLEGLSVCLPLQPESEAPCLGVQGQGAGPPSQEQTEIPDDGDDLFKTFLDFMNAYTDGATSALRSTYTEDLVEQEPAEMIAEHEPAVTIDHQAHVESATTISAEPSAPLEHAGSVQSPPAIATPPPCALPSSISYAFGSLSPLSSLGESPPMLQEGQDEIGSELHRIESLDSDEDFGAYQRRARSYSSVSVLRRKTLLRSLQSGELRGGPGASIEELSMLAKKDPHKIMISELKRKLEPSESTTQSRPPQKKTRFHADMDATSPSLDDMASSFTYLAHQLQYQGAGDPMPRYPDPSESAEDAVSLQVESISALMELGSASATGTAAIVEPAQTFMTTSEMTGPEPAANSSEPWEDSISRKKRVRSLTWKASQATAQKNVQQPERNRKPKSQRPQKRKSKSLAVQEEAQMCQWPAKSEQDGSFQRQFVQCDNCDLWYHFDCAGIFEGDPRLEEPDSVFICPPCCVSTAKRQTMRRRAGACARPDCSLTHHDTEEYVIERLVGRKTVGEAGHLFLVKWEGYPIAQASWIPEGSISGVSQVFDRFVADATAEGNDCDLKDVILLEEARHGGWDI